MKPQQITQQITIAAPSEAELANQFRRLDELREAQKRIKHALLYLDNLDLVKFATKSECNAAILKARHNIVRPFVKLRYRTRGARDGLIWNVEQTEYMMNR